MPGPPVPSTHPDEVGPLALDLRAQPIRLVIVGHQVAIADVEVLHLCAQMRALWAVPV
jgi:hypothetical protein